MSDGLTPVLEVRDLRVQAGGALVVDDLSLALRRGEALALVGESGAGKTTALRAIARLLPGARVEGVVRVGGEDILSARGARLRRLRRRAQLVFQEPGAALDPRMRVGEAVAEALAAAGVPRAERPPRVADLLARVGLDPALAGRLPHRLSGGERQRAAIARALAAGPDVLLCDEPTSALDPTVQAQVLALLERLRRNEGLALLLVSHDLALVRALAPRAVVLYAGRPVEEGPTDALLDRPLHPWTRALAAAARLDDAPPPPGEPPAPGARPTGCAFHPRCPLAAPRCRLDPPPPLRPAGPGRAVACGELAPAPR